MVFGPKQQTENRHGFNKSQTTHFPITPFLNHPPVPALPERYLVDKRSLRVTATSMETNASTERRDMLEHRRETTTTSIYDAFARPPSSVPRSDPRPVVRDRTAGLLSPIPVNRHRSPSRSSSFENSSNPPSIYSPSSTVTDLNETLDVHLRQSVLGSDGGYDSASTAGRAGRRNRSNARQQIRHPEILEEHADEDNMSGRMSIASKIKADKVLGLPASAGLASAYICSGLGVLPEAWTFADSDAIRGIKLSAESMGYFWRPEILSNCFTGDIMTDLFSFGKTSGGAVTVTDVHPPALRPDGRLIPDVGPQGARLIVAKCIKAAHPRDVEVLNAPTAPASTCHTFSFTVPRHDTLSAIARTRLGAKLPNGTSPAQAAYNNGFLDSSVHLGARGYHGSAKPQDTLDSPAAARAIRESAEIQYYGVTILTWHHADEKRHEALQKLRTNPAGMNAAARASLRSVQSIGPFAQDTFDKPKKRRLKMPWSGRTPHESAQVDTTSDADTLSPIDPEAAALVRLGIKTRSAPPKIKQYAELQQEEYSPRVLESGNIFWVPVAHTLVSRHPIYDTMLDFLRLNVCQFVKDAYWHNANILRVLNTATPRPGDLFRLRVGKTLQDEIAIESRMPGAVDFEKGIVKVDYQLWPFFQAIDIDHILVSLEVAMSQMGRVIFTSRYPHMLSVAVNTLRYVLEMRGWDGITIPMIHARDTTFIVEDPGPYIIGMPTELKSLVSIPAEVLMIDLDTNSLVCKKLPISLTPKHRREKAKNKLEAVLGPAFTQTDRGVPIDFKVTLPMGAFKPLNHIIFPGHLRPDFMDRGIQPPEWWKQTEIMTAFDKIMGDKHKKPSLIQRLTRMGVNRVEAHLTVGEQVAKVMMRRRALHYLEARDQLEIKISKVNSRLAAIAVDGRFWRREFHKFESYATQLAKHTEKLRAMVDKEKQDAKRFSTLVAEETKARSALELKLQATEDARAEAMRQLSDMHQSIQELEREREQIMDVFEDQLNVALESVPESESRSPTPAESVLESPQPPPRSPLRAKTAPSRSRPATRDSQLSSLSKLTSATQPLSMMGAMRHAADKHRGDNISILSNDSGAYERSDYVARRIAAIQAKLEAALQAPIPHRAVSAATHLETVEDEEETGDNLPASRPQSADNINLPDGSPIYSDHTPVGSAVRRRRPASVQVHASDWELIEDTTFGQGGGPDGALAKLEGRPVPRSPTATDRYGTSRGVSFGSTLSRQDSLMKPGISYRVRPKRISSSSQGRISIANKRKDGTDVFEPPSQSNYENLPTSSTEGSIITPSQSNEVFNNMGVVGDADDVVRVDACEQGEDEEKIGEQVGDEQEEIKRSSAISMATVTFG